MHLAIELVRRQECEVRCKAPHEADPALYPSKAVGELPDAGVNDVVDEGMGVLRQSCTEARGAVWSREQVGGVRTIRQGSCPALEPRCGQGPV